MIRIFEGHAPRLDPTAFVHDSAEIVGRVSLGRKASVWPMAVLRGDISAIRVGEGSNIQDSAVLHGREGSPVRIGRGVTVGHGAIVHGARVGDYCLVGMGAVVMEARIGPECLIAAGAVVPPGFVAPPRSLVMGLPAKVIRRLKPGEVRHLHDSEKGYRALARRHRQGARVVFGGPAGGL